MFHLVGCVFIRRALPAKQNDGYRVPGRSADVGQLGVPLRERLVAPPSSSFRTLLRCPQGILVPTVVGTDGIRVKSPGEKGL